jgi:hypothetical protein
MDEGKKMFDFSRADGGDGDREGDGDRDRGALRSASCAAGAGSAVMERLEARRLLAVDSPPLTRSFDGPDYATGGSTVPADCNVAVGPQHVLSVINSHVEWRGKTGSAAQGGASLNAFFASLTPTRPFDPRAVFDPYANRFVITAADRNSTTGAARVLVAASDDADPNGAWRFQSLDAAQDGLTWADFPAVAADEEAIYVTATLIPNRDVNLTYRPALWIVDKQALYAGRPVAAKRYDPLAGTTVVNHDLRPAQPYGPGLPAGVGTFLVGMSTFTLAGQEHLLDVVRVDNPLGTPKFTHQKLKTGVIEGVGVETTQKGGGPPISAGGSHTLQAVWRNNALYQANTIRAASGVDAGQPTAQWIRIDTSNLASLRVADRGTLGGEEIASGTHTFYPSLAVDSKGNMAIGFSASGTGIYPGAYYAVRAASDPPGTMRLARPLAAGRAHYGNAANAFERWGDYSGMAIDPVADGTFWAFNQYAIPFRAGLAVNYGTRYGQFSIASGGASIAGTVFSDDDADGVRDAAEPLLSARRVYLDADNDGVFDAAERSVLTDGAGGYRFTGLAAGTYRVRRVMPSGYRLTVPPGGYHLVTLTSTQAVSGRDFGAAPTTLARPTLRIDTGGNGFTDGGGRKWDADRGFGGGGATDNAAFPVANTTDDPLYVTRRYGASFSYKLAAPNGRYRLRLLFADPLSTRAGQRVFSVFAEGSRVITDLDLFTVAGAKAAVSRSVDATVSGGALELSFQAKSGNAIISAIELTPI